MERDLETAVAVNIDSDLSPSIHEITVSSSTEDITTENYNEEKIPDSDSLKSFVWQTIPPFLLAGVGMVGAGALFDNASNEEFMRSGALNLVPALLGLNGNLQMTLASRISTMANLGFIDKRKEQLWALICNVGLIQVQAIVVSLMAAIVAILVNNVFTLSIAIWLMASATLTLAVGSLLLASLMVLLTVIAKKLKINPDNIATPLAGTTGDVTTIYLFIKIASYFYKNREPHLLTHCIILFFLLASTVGWVWIASRQKGTLQVLKYGWGAVLTAMCFSSGSGVILDKSTSQFQYLAKFQTVINGVGGNLVAIHSSKISTYLHKFAKKGELPTNRLLTYFNPIYAFNCKNKESIQGTILLFLAIPAQLVLAASIHLLNGLPFDLLFLALYLVVSFVQVALLLYICQWLCRMFWVCKLNPDVNSIPILTALGDLFGAILLFCAFYICSVMNAKKLNQAA